MGKKPQPTKKANPGQSITRFFDKTATQACKQQQAVSTAAPAGPDSTRTAALTSAAAPTAQRQQPGAGPVVSAAAQPTNVAATVAPKLSAKQAVKAKRATGSSGATRDSSSKHVKTATAAGPSQHKHGDKKKPHKPLQGQQTSNQQQHASGVVNVQAQSAQQQGADADGSARALPKAQAATTPSAATAQHNDLKATARTSALQVCHQQQQARRCSSDQAGSLKAAAMAAPAARGQAAADAVVAGVRSTASTDKPKATAAAATASRPSRFNPYVSGQHTGMLMSQADEDMEVAWRPSPPKDLEILLQQQQQQVTTNSGTATSAAATTNSATPSDTHGVTQPGGSAKSSSGLGQQQQLAPAAAAAMAAAAAASSADEVLEKLLDSLSDNPQQQQQHVDQLVMSTPGGPRLRAFRNHSVVPPSTGNKPTGRHQSYIRPGSAAAPGTAGGSSTGTHQHNSSNGSSTVKRKQAGLKRRDLFDLLDRVEGLVKRRRASGDELPASAGDTDLEMMDVQATDDEHSMRDAVNSKVALEAAGDQAAVDDGDAVVDDILAELEADRLNMHKSRYSQQQQRSEGTPMQGAKQQTGVLGPRSSRLSHVIDQQQQQQQQQQCLTPATGPAKVTSLQGEDCQHAAAAAGSDDSADTPQQQLRGVESAATQAAHETVAAVAIESDGADCVPDTPAGDDHAAAVAAVAESSVPVTIAADTRVEATSNTESPAIAVSTQRKEHEHAVGYESAAVKQAAPSSTSPSCQVVEAATAGSAAAAAFNKLEGMANDAEHVVAQEQVVAECTQGAAAVAANDCGASSQEARAAIAAKELAEFELLYGFDDADDEVNCNSDAVQQAPTTEVQQQQLGQQQQQQVDDTQPAHKRQRVSQPSNDAAAAAVNLCAAQAMQHQLAAAAAAAGDVGLAGGRADVYHIIQEVHQDMTDTHLRCFNPYKGCELHVHLSHPWNDCPIAVGDAVNIIGGTTSTDEQGRAHVHLDYQHGLFVMHPDVLLSGTSITTALSCTRRAWLSERFAAAGGGPSAAALRGTLLHELLQRLLVEVVGDDSRTPLPGLQQLQQMVVDVLDDFGEKLQEVGLTEKTAAAEMNKHLENISAWLRKYLPQPQQQQQQHQSWQRIQQQQQQQNVKSASGGWRGGSGCGNSGFDSSSNAYGGVVDAGPNNGLDQPPRVLIQGVADIEENIWAPRYGLKGQIDASLLVSLTRRQPASAANTGQWGGSGYQQQQQHGQRSWGAGLSTGQQGSAAGRFSNHSGHQVLGSGWSVAGFSSGGGVHHGGASGAGGSSASGRGVSGFSQRQPQNPSCGGVFGNAGYSRAPGWQRPQPQQQQRNAAGVLQQLDMNAAGGLQQGNVFSQPATAAAAGGTDVCGVAGPVSAAGGGGVGAVNEQLRVFKGKLSGAVAASRAVQQSRAAGQNIPHQQRHQHQQLSVPGANSGGGAAAVSNAWMGSSGGGRHMLANHQQQQQSCDTELLIMPFEFKSGKDYFSHRAQVSLYLLLMEARYQLGLLPAGLLWNVNSPNMALVPAKQEEIAPLLACRNRLAVYLWQDSPLPPQVLGDAHTCSRCHSASTCAAVHAVVEHGTASSSGMSEAQWDSLAGAVTAAAAAWGRKWLNCIDWEEAAGRNRRAELWAMTGAQRQAKGNCIAGLQYVCSHPVKASATQGSADKVYMYTFRQITGSSSSSRSSDDDRSNAAVLEEPEQQQADFADLTAVVDPVDAVVAECISKSQRHAGSSSSNGQAISSGRSSSSSTGSLAGMPVAPGDVLILGVDGVQVNVGRVEVAEIDGTVITVASQKALQLERYLAAQPLSPAAAGDGNDSAAADGNINATVTWRLDRDEAASTAMFQRANVLRVASDSSSSRVIRLRQLLIDLEPPQQVRHEGEEQQAVIQFNQPKATGEAGQEQQQHEQAATPAAAAAVAGYVRPVARMAMAAGERYLAQHGANLNGDQVAVVKRVVQMQDYSLVLGMPGTGKTSTIVHAIRALASAGASILVTSYTNSALDNILLKLVECGVHDFLRLGRASSCHAGVRDYMPGSQRYPQRSTSELQQLAASTPIVGCPCLSVHHPLLAARPPFDVVIVDEAGQISLPAVLGALLKARSFVLVGDHYQLPPLVLDKRAAEGGLSVSLFRQLCEAHPGAVVVLKRQYRMCRPIMGLANELVYGGQLEAGSEQVEQAQLHLPAPDALHQLPDWVSSLLQPSCRLCFVNTDSIKPAALAADSLAASGSGGVVNAGEAKVVMQLLDGLLAAGVPGAEIGVISPYKAQVALLQQLLDSRSQIIAGSSSSSKQDHAASQAAAVEVMTIDKCQGRDKDVLLLSFVRSNPKGAVGNLLNDWQRLNVALTRAKVKLLMIGSARTLGGGVPLLQKMIDWVQQQQGLVSLPQDALQH